MLSERTGRGMALAAVGMALEWQHVLLPAARQMTQDRVAGVPEVTLRTCAKSDLSSRR
mgnify:CR=1 FL=1